MKSHSFAVSVVCAAFFLGSCGSDAPSQPTAPVVVATPTPAPTPAPSRGNTAVRVNARTFGYTRNEGSGQGRFAIPPEPPFFQWGDWIDMDCTPRDDEGRPTNNHPDFAEWYYSSGGAGVLIDRYDYVVEEDHRYNPQVQIRYLSRTGYIEMYCKIPGTNIVSNVVRINVFGGIR